jgi:hypothetical protein
MPILRARGEWARGRSRDRPEQTFFVSLAFPQLTHYIWLR